MPAPGRLATLGRALRRVQAELRRRVMASMRRGGAGRAARVDRETAGDTIFAIDRVTEDALSRLLEREVAPVASFVLVAEGFEGAEARRVFPRGTSPADAEFVLIVDPIDGTRGLMYDKRSAWSLAAAAPNRGPRTGLADIVVAVQTEIPTTKQWRSDVLWAVRGRGAEAAWEDVRTGRRGRLRLRPSRARGLEQGFAMLARFFPGGKDMLARMEEELMEAVVGPVEPGKAKVFEDQYISTGGQFYELIAGRDRFNADLRGWLSGVGGASGPDRKAADVRPEPRLPPLLACHPYDVCTALIAEEAGVTVTDPGGRPLDGPLDTTSPVSWVAYANSVLRRRIEPVLKGVLEKYSRFK